MKDKIRVVIVDDHSLLREGVASILENEVDFDVVGQGATTDDAVRLANSLQPDLVLLDIDMAGRNLATARTISIQCPLTRILFLTITESGESAVKINMPPGCAYVLKNIDGQNLVRILKAVYHGETYLPQALAVCLLCEYNDLRITPHADHTWFNNLTEIECQTLEYISTGLSYAEIGQLLHLSDKAIKGVVAGIMHKINVRNRVEPALVAGQKHRKNSREAFLAIELGKK